MCLTNTLFFDYSSTARCSEWIILLLVTCDFWSAAGIHSWTITIFCLNLANFVHCNFKNVLLMMLPFTIGLFLMRIVHIFKIISMHSCVGARNGRCDYSLLNARPSVFPINVLLLCILTFVMVSHFDGVMW